MGTTCVVYYHMAYTTRGSLLLAIGRGDEIAWREFYNTYRPLIVFCAQGRIAPDEIDDLIQTVMLKVFRSGERFRYDPAKGKFRDYLGGIIRNAIIDVLRKRRPEKDGPMPLENDEDTFAAAWRAEWEHHILAQAVDELRRRVTPSTFQAFDLYALQEQPPAKVAAFLGVDVSRVYKAKLRCLDILRRIVDEIRRREEA